MGVDHLQLARRRRRDRHPQRAARLQPAEAADGPGSGPALISRSGRAVRMASPYCSSSTCSAALKWKAMPSRCASRCAWSTPPVRARPTSSSCSATMSGDWAGDHLGDAPDVEPAVGPDAAVDVVGEDADHRSRLIESAGLRLASAASTSARGSPSLPPTRAGAAAWERKPRSRRSGRAASARPGRLQYEPPKLIFRGAARRVFDADSLAQIRADGRDLVLADGARFRLADAGGELGRGDPQSQGTARQAGREDRPAGRSVVNLDDPAFAAELAARRSRRRTATAGLDLLFYGADSADELARIGRAGPPASPRVARCGSSR